MLNTATPNLACKDTCCETEESACLMDLNTVPPFFPMIQ